MATPAVSKTLTHKPPPRAPKMCILAQPVESVSDTSIFAAFNTDRTRQVVVYEMAVEFRGSGNAMILPVPVPMRGNSSTGEIELIDMTAYPNFFKDLADLFRPRYRGLMKGVPSNSFLKVVDVGSYKVSIAATVDEAERVNPDVFTLSAETRAALNEHYRFGYHFIVAQLQTGGKFHPLAYSHPTSGVLFFPTRHEHGDGHHLPKWDHTIYHQPGGAFMEEPRSVQTRKQEGRSIQSVQSQTIRVAGLAEFLSVTEPIEQKKIKGHGKNLDLQVW